MSFRQQKITCDNVVDAAVYGNVGGGGSLREFLDNLLDSLEENLSAFPSGTQLTFFQTAAPSKWTKQTSVNDVAVRIVSGSTGGKTSGTTAFSTMFSSSYALPMSGNVGATTLSVAQIPSHSHTFTDVGSTGIMGSVKYRIAGDGATNTLSVGATGGSQSHTHSVSGNATVNLAVKYIDAILCKKD